MSDEVFSADDEVEEPATPNENDALEAVSPEDLAVAAKRYAQVTGKEFPQGSQYPHAGNIAKKLKDHSGKGTELAETIDEILRRYTAWREATFEASGDRDAVIVAKVEAFESYSTYLDCEAVDKFDSRGALVSSALEEFCHYLLQPLTYTYSTALLGKHDTYQGLYFTAPNFEQLLRLPNVHTPVNTLDYIIGAKICGRVSTDTATKDFDIRLPAVAIECKGYLDRPRFIESQNMARQIKSSFPQCMYILIAQTLKLNLQKIGVAPDIDAIYVWRRMQNIDRKARRKIGLPLSAIHVPAVVHFYERVEHHLTSQWQLADPFGSGILK